MREWLRRHLAFLLLLVLGAALRLVGLGWLPAPAGDEGNWTLWGLELARHHPVQLPPDAGFVSLLHARLIALSLGLLGPSFFAARLAGALAALAAVTAAYAVPAALGQRRAGLAAAAVLAVHPWALLWARTAAVPYALALATGTVGPLVFVAGLHRRSLLAVALAVQVVALGAQFSPLAITAALACAALALLPAHRWVLGRPAFHLALAAAALHTAPILFAASLVARSAPAREHTSHLGVRLASYLHMVGTGLGGEATLRHFSHAALPVGLAAAVIVPVLLVVALAARAPVRAWSATRSLGPLYFAVALLAMPLVLAPARAWHLPRIDTDRYLFAILPAFALCVGDLASAPGRWPARLALAVVALLGLASLRVAHALVRGGGPDCGAEVFSGGAAYRGWRVARGGAAPVSLIAATLRRLAPPGAVVLLPDQALRPLAFAAADAPVTVVEVEYAPLPARAAQEVFFVLWADDMFACRTTPLHAREQNRALRRRMETEFLGAERVARWVQPDGQGLVELWRARRP